MGRTNHRTIGADGAIEIDGSTASGFDTRMNAALSEAYKITESSGVYVHNDTQALSQLTPDLVIRMFPSAPRANIEKHLPIVRRALAERGLVDRTMVLMALATVRAESAAFEPVSEAPSALNTRSPGPPFNKYDWRQDLGNTGPPDGAMFKGRGFIQLTGKKNYRFYGALLGYDLIENPELANTPQPAAQILAAYLKVNEPSIRSALSAGDLAAARRIVNGGLNGLYSFRSAFTAGDSLMRDYESDVALSKEPQGRRGSRKLKEVDEADERVQAPDRDNDAYGKARPKRKDDAADEKARVKKKDDQTEEDDEKPGKDVKKKGKGFFLFRPFRLFRGAPSTP
jgi:peptidoglycan L-alanyl-D-glutamate endopeptidase CwlK